MPQRSGTGLWITGGVAVVAIGAGLFYWTQGAETAAETPRGQAARTFSESSSIPELAEAIRHGGKDASALELLHKKLTAGEASKAPLTEGDAAAVVDALGAIRSGFLQFSAPGRAASTVVAGAILDRFSVDPAPPVFMEALKPIHDIYVAALADAEPEVRFVALGQTHKFWSWIPGRTLSEADEKSIGDWKEAIHRPVVRCLAVKDPRTRAAAIYSLGFLRIDTAAAPALAYANDPAVEVRRQVIVSFAARPTLLSEDILIQRIHDEDTAIREAAFSALKLRGLNQEQISLGVLMTSPRADQRASVISLIKDRADIDPVVWLLRLTHDAEESVRIQAVEALGARKVEDASVKRRIVEMAQSDSSQAVRQAAGKLMPSREETTAALPPLPGSSLLNPKAN